MSFSGMSFSSLKSFFDMAAPSLRTRHAERAKNRRARARAQTPRRRRAAPPSPREPAAARKREIADSESGHIR